MQNRTFLNIEERDASQVYDFHLLAGHLIEQDDVDEVTLKKFSEDAEILFSESKREKGLIKTLHQIDALILFSKTLSVLKKCKIDDEEALFSFICIRFPELELDWFTLQNMLLLKKKFQNSDKNEERIEVNTTLDVAVNLYISALRQEIEKMMNNG